MVEVRGFEPLSRSLQKTASTSLAVCLSLAFGARNSALSAGQIPVEYGCVPVSRTAAMPANRRIPSQRVSEVHRHSIIKLRVRIRFRHL